MNRRAFLIGATVGVASGCRLFRKSKSDDPLVKDLKRSPLIVLPQTAQCTHLRSDERSITGWEFNLEEDDFALFEFTITNHGPKKVRAVHCQPLCSDPVTHVAFWRVFQQFDPVETISGQVLKRNWRACNDSNFIFMEINTTGSQWDAMNADDDRTSMAWTDTANTVAHMEWYLPQEVHFEVRGNRGNMRVQC